MSPDGSAKVWQAAGDVSCARGISRAEPVLHVEQVDGEITSFIADGAYDGDPVYQAVARQQHDPPSDVVIPPRASAVLSTDSTDRQSQRDQHIRMIAEKGRMAGLFNALYI